MTEDIRPARPEEVEPLARVMAEAFRSDTFYRWLLPTEDDWRRGGLRSFEGMLRRLVPAQAVLTTPGLEGAIAWYPSRHRPGLRLRLAHVADQLHTARILGRRIPQVRRGIAELERHRLREPHCYFAGVGIAPAHQQSRLGSALIAAFFAHCDRSGEPVCGVASSDRHVALYRHHGAELAGDPVTLPDGPTLWPMLRRPRGSGPA